MASVTFLAMMTEQNTTSPAVDKNDTTADVSVSLSLWTFSICASIFVVNVVVGSVVNACVVWTIWKTKSLRFSSINLAVLSLCIAGTLSVRGYWSCRITRVIKGTRIRLQQEPFLIFHNLSLTPKYPKCNFKKFTSLPAQKAANYLTLH